jgi:hypothetical protein
MFSKQVNENFTLLDLGSIPDDFIYTFNITPRFDMEMAVQGCALKINEKVYRLTHPLETFQRGETMDETTATKEGGRYKKKRKTIRQKKKCYRRSRRIRKQIRK